MEPDIAGTGMRAIEALLEKGAHGMYHLTILYYIIDVMHAFKCVYID